MKKEVYFMKGKRLLCLLLALVFVCFMAACNKTSQTDKTTAATTTKKSTAATTTAQASGTTTKEIQNFNPTGYPIVNEEITIKVINPYNTVVGAPWTEEFLLYKRMRELTNIHVEFTNVPVGEWETKMNLALASDDDYDFYMGDVGAKNIYDYGIVGGKFLNFRDLIDDYMPHLLSWLPDYPVFLKVVTESDGGIYSFPRIVRTATMNPNDLFIRLDFMREAGIHKEPGTIEEYYECMKAIDAKYGDDPEFVAVLPNDPTASMVKVTFGAFGDLAELDFTDVDGRVVCAYTTEQYYRALKFWRKMAEEGLLSTDYYSMEAGTLMELINQGKCASSNNMSQMVASDIPSGSYDDVTILAPLKSTEYGTTPKNLANMGLSRTNMVITHHCENVEALLRWCDILYAREPVTPESGLYGMAGWLGIEGVTWEYGDPEKKTWKYILPPDLTVSTYEWQMKNVAPQALFNVDFMAVSLTQASVGSAVRGRAYVEKIRPYDVMPSSLRLCTYTSDEMERYNTLLTDITTHVKQMEAKFITGSEPLTEASFEAFKRQLDSMGLQELMEIMQNALDRFNAL